MGGMRKGRRRGFGVRALTTVRPEPVEACPELGEGGLFVVVEVFAGRKTVDRG